MATRIDLQNDDGLSEIPSPELFRVWVEASLQRAYGDLEQTIRIVGSEEIRALNRDYRRRDAATNVLAFPSDAELLDYDCLGDLVICAPVVAEEAVAQRKQPDAHWAHMVVHGMLHLQGFDHEDASQAASMEAIEIKILDGLGYANPYNE